MQGADVENQIVTEGMDHAVGMIMESTEVSLAAAAVISSSDWEPRFSSKVWPLNMQAFYCMIFYT